MLGVEILTWVEGSTRPWYTAPGWRTAVALLTPKWTVTSHLARFKAYDFEKYIHTFYRIDTEGKLEQ